MIDITHYCFVILASDASIKSSLDWWAWKLNVNHKEDSVTTRVDEWYISLPQSLLDNIKYYSGKIIYENSQVKVHFDNNSSMTKFKLSL